MAECFISNAEQERCRCGMFVSKDHLQDGRIRYQCHRCGPQLEFKRRRGQEPKTA